MAKLQVEGLDKLEKALRENVTMYDVKKVVRQNGAQLQQKTQQNADFTQGYQTGTTKRSIRLDMTDGGFTAEVGATTEYAPYVEYGTRFMEAQPFVEPALNEQKDIFISDLKKIMQ